MRIQWVAVIALVAAWPGARIGPDSTWTKIAPFFTAPESYRNDFGSLPATLRFRDGRPIKTAADWKKRRKELLAEWHSILGPWPPLLRKPTVTYLAEDRVENFTRHKLLIEIAPGRTTDAFLLLPDGKGPFPGVVDVYYQPLDGAGLNPERRQQNDFGYQLVKRGFAALCVGTQPWLNGPIYYPDFERAQLQPLSYLAYVAANCHTILAGQRGVASKRIGIVGHSYGGKWSLFAGALYDKFACVVLSDPGIVFDETRPNVNYWEPWYLGHEPGKQPRKAGVPTESNPRTGPYKRLIETGRDLNELLVLIAPRPFFLAGGSEDPASRWQAINHLVAVNALLGHKERAGMSARPEHKISPEANEQICLVFQHFLGRR